MDSRRNYFSTLLFAPARYQPLNTLYISQSLLLFCYQRIVEISFVSQNKRSIVFTKPLGNDNYRIVCSVYIQLLRNQGAGLFAQTRLELQYNMQIL